MATINFYNQDIIKKALSNAREQLADFKLMQHNRPKVKIIKFLGLFPMEWPILYEDVKFREMRFINGLEDDIDLMLDIQKMLEYSNLYSDGGIVLKEKEFKIIDNYFEINY